MPRVMIINDDPAPLLVIRKLLEKQGVEINSTSDGEPADLVPERTWGE